MKNKYFVISLVSLLLFMLINFIMQYVNYPSMFSSIEDVPICNGAENFEDIECVNFKSKADPLIRYYQFINESSFDLIIYISPLFIIIPSAIYIYKKMKNNYMKNILTRIDYKLYIKSIYKEIFKNAFLLPLFVIFMLLICAIIAKNFNFGQVKEFYSVYASPSIEFYGKIPIFLFQYILNIFLYSIVYINITLICSYKNSNIFIMVIYSYLFFFILDILGEVLIGGLLFSRILNNHTVGNYLNLLNIWAYYDVNNMTYLNIYPLFLVIISSFVMHVLYKNKERTIIENE